MSAEIVDAILVHPAFSDVDPDAFPDSLPLREILSNDARYRRFSRGDILFRRGDYGNSLFVLIKGSVRGVDSDAAVHAVTLREPVRRRSWFDALSQLWRNSRIPEFRQRVRYAPLAGAGRDRVGTRFDRAFVVSQNYVGRQRRRMAATFDENGIVRTATYEGPDRRGGAGDMTVTRLADVDAVIDAYQTFALEAPTMFGEIAALSRSPRTATVFAENDVEVVELRWQGLRDIRRWSDRFRLRIDELYRERGLLAHLRAAPIFAKLDDSTLREIASETLFETYGDFEWTQHFQRVRSREATTERMIEHEPVIAQEGNYIDGLLLIRWGFARVSRKVDSGEMTIEYLSSNDAFGLDDIRGAVSGTGDNRLTRSLRAIGYVDVLRVPTRLIERYVVPTLETEAPPPETPDISNDYEPLMDFLVDNRIINGTAAMVINTDRCVNCDDCVNACAATHDGNPRFVRHGIAHLNLTIANACMHCVDPVCLIGCPTGAIHRQAETRNVFIDDATCIGCGTCAQSCPYNNIRMVETRGADGAFIVDDENVPIVKATKCDLCASQPGGPACQRACPHDALIRVDIRDISTLTRWIDQ